MSDKKYTPREAGQMVLAKAEELYKSSNLAKGDWAKIHSKLKREGYSEESADKIDGAIKAKMGKSEEAIANPDEKADAELGEEVEHAVEDHEKENAGAESQEAGMKGHIKLAKFVGWMRHKKSQKAKEMDKGENQPHPGATSAVPAYQAAGQAQAEAHLKTPEGNAERMQGNAQRMQQAAPTKGAHEQTLDQIHQMSKPKLPG
jgi:hypothetical protein